MRFPSKVTTYKESIISKLPVLAKYLSLRDYTVISLFNEIRDKMTIHEYIDALDCLFVLGKITLKEEILHYVERDLL
jgi:hypothetical protein